MNTIENISAADIAIARNKQSLNNFLNTYGSSNQIMMALEESGELIQALAKTQRFMKGEDGLGDVIDHLAEEIADVRIMLAQIEMIFDIDKKIAAHVQEKVNRQNKRLSTDIEEDIVDVFDDEDE